MTRQKNWKGKKRTGTDNSWKNTWQKQIQTSQIWTILQTQCCLKLEVPVFITLLTKKKSMGAQCFKSHTNSGQLLASWIYLLLGLSRMLLRAAPFTSTQPVNSEELTTSTGQGLVQRWAQPTSGQVRLDASISVHCPEETDPSAGSSVAMVWIWGHWGWSEAVTTRRQEDTTTRWSKHLGTGKANWGGPSGIILAQSEDTTQVT